VDLNFFFKKKDKRRKIKDSYSCVYRKAVIVMIAAFFFWSYFPLFVTIFFIFKEKIKKDFHFNRGYLITGTL
jgi:hypothetical protein